MAYQQPAWDAVDCDFTGSYTAPAWDAVDVDFTDSFDGQLGGVTGAVTGGFAGVHGVAGALGGVTGAVAGGFIGEAGAFEAILGGVTADVSGGFTGAHGVAGELSGLTGSVSGGFGGVVGVSGSLGGVTGSVSGGFTATQPQQRVSGVVQDASGSPLGGRTVRVHRRADGALLGESISLGDGTWSAFAGFEEVEVYAVALHLDPDAEDFTPPCANRVLSYGI